MELNGLALSEDTELPSLQRTRWKHDDLMRWLSEGERRVEFLGAAGTSLSESEDTWGGAPLNRG
eukprot:3873940-Pyramimonas_sp.AAC.1